MTDIRSRRFLLLDVALKDKPAFRSILRGLGGRIDCLPPGLSDSQQKALLVGWITSVWQYCEHVSRRSFDDIDDLCDAACVPVELIEEMMKVKWIVKAKGGKNGKKITVFMWVNSRGEVGAKIGQEDDIGAVSVSETGPNGGGNPPAQKTRQKKTKKTPLRLSTSEWAKQAGESLQDRIKESRARGSA